MVTQLEFYRKDPNGLGRGQGKYYLRGGKRDGEYTLPSGKTVKGAYYSKYSEERDKNRLSRGHETHKVGMPKPRAKKYAHVTDGQLSDNRVHKVSFNKLNQKQKNGKKGQKK